MSRRIRRAIPKSGTRKRRGEVYRFPGLTAKGRAIKVLSEALEAAHAGEFEKVAISATLKSGEAVTAYANADLQDIRMLGVHIESDYIYRLIAANMDRLLEQEGF